MISLDVEQLKELIDSLVDQKLGVKGNGGKHGRPKGSPLTTERVQEARAMGLSQSQAARMTGLGLATVKRHWNVLPLY